jgi:hypothetical protein
MTNVESLLTVDEAAAVCQMSPSWIKSRIDIGRLKPTKLGKIVRIELYDLRAFIDSFKTNVVETVTTLSIPDGIDTDTGTLEVAEKRRS